ncbi:MAG: phage tail sheath family protein [Myxococcota bacterium]
MRPGISIQHGSLPDRAQGLVRMDIGGIVGFVPESRWPEEATAGDFVELVLRRSSDLDDHPQRELFDPPTRRAVRHFFENGGDTLHLFGVCVESLDALKQRTGDDGPLAPLLHRLRAEDDIALLAVPAAAYMRCEVLRSGKVISDADALYDELLAHCRQMTNRFLLVDAPRGLHGDVLFRWVEQFRERERENRSFGAVYYPWIMRGDACDPPSGSMMGVYARLALQRMPFGIAQPPANVAILGATHTEVELDWGEVGLVGDAGINPIIVQPGRGVIVWGARTLSRDKAWQYVNSRRIVSMISDQLRRDNEWTVFEVNEPGLWKIVERDVMVRLLEFLEGGLISGTRSAREFSVECSEALNPLEARNSGVLNVHVALKPVGTTESILIDLRLGSDGA